MCHHARLEWWFYKEGLFFEIYLFLILCVCVFCLSVCMCIFSCPVLSDVRRGHWAPLGLELQSIVSHHVFDGNRIPDPLQEQVLLTTEPLMVFKEINYN